MSEELNSQPDTDVERSRIVRALYDATKRDVHSTDAAQMVEAREAISRLQLQVDALADRDFSAAFRAALRHLVPPTTNDAS